VLWSMHQNVNIMTRKFFGAFARTDSHWLSWWMQLALYNYLPAWSMHTNSETHNHNQLHSSEGFLLVIGRSLASAHAASSIPGIPMRFPARGLAYVTEMIVIPTAHQKVSRMN